MQRRFYTDFSQHKNQSLFEFILQNQIISNHYNDTNKHYRTQR